MTKEWKLDLTPIIIIVLSLEALFDLPGWYDFVIGLAVYPVIMFYLFIIGILIQVSMMKPTNVRKVPNESVSVRKDFWWVTVLTVVLLAVIGWPVTAVVLAGTYIAIRVLTNNLANKLMLYAGE